MVACLMDSWKSYNPEVDVAIACDAANDLKELFALLEDDLLLILEIYCHCRNS